MGFWRMKDSAVKDVAKGMIAGQLRQIQKSKETESLTMIRKAAEGDDDGIMIKCEYTGAKINIPFYTYYILKTMAGSMGTTFKDLIRMAEAYNDLMKDVAKEKTETIEKMV